jgi:ADP-ribose pyrophosphatase YjhB (NUDIX family)
MHRKNLREKLERYNPTDEREIADKVKMLEFLNSHETCFERSLSIGHFTGSCWLINRDGTKFLLTLHKKIGRWLQLGGHADGDSDILRVAMKEAHEESGLEHLEFVSEEIFDIGIYPFPERNGIHAHLHYSVAFLVRASNLNEDIKISDESLDLRWFEKYPFDVMSSVDEEREITRQFLKWKNLRQR